MVSQLTSGSVIPSSTPTVSVPDNDEAATQASEDYNNFLLLMTAQMRNQDPLKPLDSTDFVAQLAQFSAVEQQINGNTTLKEIAANMQQSSLQDAAGFLGKIVRSSAVGLQYNGQEEIPLSYDLPLEEQFERAQAVIQDENSNILRIIPIKDSAANGSLVWDGRDQQGKRLANGRYDIKIQGFNGDIQIFEQDALLEAPIKEIYYNENKIVLKNDFIDKIDIEDVEAIFESEDIIS